MHRIIKSIQELLKIMLYFLILIVRKKINLIFIFTNF